MTEYARDTFSRTVASGWGTGEIGGAWSESLSNATSAVVANTQARITFTGTLAARADEQLAAVTPASDVMATCRFTTYSTWLVAGTWGTYVTLWLRASGSGAATAGYYAQAKVSPNGAMRLSIGYSLTGTLVELAHVNYPAGTTIANRQWWLEFEARGASPTKLRARLWHTSAPVPGPFQGWLETEDETGPSIAGVVAIRLSRDAPPSSGQLADVLDYYATDPPIPRFTWSATGLAATFDATSSGGDLGYTWDWGDGTAAGSGATPSHAYAGPGTYRVTLTGLSRWGATFRSRQYVTVALPLPATGQLVPMVRINGVDVCDAVYGMSWSTGRRQWAEQLTGQTCSLRLRGIFGASQGQTVTVAVPAAAGGEPLWSGVIDQVTEGYDPVEDRDETMIIAMDTASQLARLHLEPATILPAVQLPARLDDLSAFEWITIRAGYAGVPSARWLQLKKKTQAADKLRDRTYLELINDALAASLAFGYTARDGAIVYAPWEAPSGLASSPSIDLEDGADCASRVTLDRNSVDGIVNRWTVASGDDFDVLSRPSIEAYGERAYGVPSDTLNFDPDFPFGPPDFLGMLAAMAEPLRAAEVDVAVTDWSQLVITAEPLDFATWDGRLYSILGIRHEVTLGAGWRVVLTLDRNPWEIDGRTPPAAALLPAPELPAAIPLEV